MVESYYTKDGYPLIIENKYYNTLDIESFSLMMKDPSSCYKFYWLEAIVKLISEGITKTTFDAVINEMIANAWYSVREFHIHLSGYQNGEVRDGLERAVNKLAELNCNLSSNAAKAEIKEEIAKHATDLEAVKEQMTHLVPCRALAGFFKKAAEPVVWDTTVTQRMVAYIERINQSILLPYTFGKSNGLKKEICFNPEWVAMIQDNTVAILGWIQYEKTKWLQTNNPGVPGIIYKLAPLDKRTRKLSKVRDLWESVMSIKSVYDIYNDKLLTKDYYEVDHFIPWSFVMNNELWNLAPMDPGLNSIKSNNLADWNSFFKKFANRQFMLYELIQTDSEVHKRYQRCFKDNLYSIWAEQELYRPGNTKEEFCNILEKNMHPVYDSARRQGYELWNFNAI